MSVMNVCPCPVTDHKFRVESLPFADVPHQSKLFLEYQTNPLLLKRFYPNAVDSHTQIAKNIPEVLNNYKTDRAKLCDVLLEMNGGELGSEKTLENISLLREADTVAVVSGQQAGLFTGPLYTIYKALSAVKLADCLNKRGFKAVPVFWIATEDHDFLEVSNVFEIDKSNNLIEIRNEPKRCYDNLPVGYVKNDDSIRETIDELFRALPYTEFTDEVRTLIESSWKSGEYYGDAFARMLAQIIGKFGLILLCPLSEKLKELAKPIYIDAVRKSGEMVSALQKRSEQLLAEGYHAQVLVTDDYFPIFYQAPDKTRHALKKTEDGKFRAKGINREFSIDDLVEIAETEPESLSPSVVLRSVVQDYLLPTVCYFGGAAEIAYFAQSAEVYRILGRPVTTILHRQSFTIVESRMRSALDKFQLNLKDLFRGEETITREVVEAYLNPETAIAFDEVERRLENDLDMLQKNLEGIDRTLAEHLAHRRMKIQYQLASVRTNFHHIQIRKDETAKRQIDNLFTALLPHKHLQERTLNVVSILNKYGLYFVDWVFEAIDLDDKGHRILSL